MAGVVIPAGMLEIKDRTKNPTEPYEMYINAHEDLGQYPKMLPFFLCICLLLSLLSATKNNCKRTKRNKIWIKIKKFLGYLKGFDLGFYQFEGFTSDLIWVFTF